jgi:hypothetical protein
VATTSAKVRDRGKVGCGGEDPVHLFDPAELGAADRNVGLGPSHDWGLHTLRTPLA